MAVLIRDKALWFAYYWLPVVILSGFIAFSSSIPGQNVPCLFRYEDILYHFGIYVILSLFFIRALKNTGAKRPVVRLIALTVIFCCLYGLSDEVHQLFTPGRSCSVLDLLIDTAGALTGAVAAGVYFTWRS